MTSGILTTSWQQGGQTLSTQYTITASGNGQGGFAVDLALTALQSNVEFALAFDKDLIKAFVVENPTLAVSIETNDSAEPDDTIPVPLGQGYVWTFASGLTNPFTADPTKAYITNLTNAAGTVRIRGIVDSTP